MGCIMLYNMAVKDGPKSSEEQEKFLLIKRETDKYIEAMKNLLLSQDLPGDIKCATSTSPDISHIKKNLDQQILEFENNKSYSNNSSREIEPMKIDPYNPNYGGNFIRGENQTHTQSKYLSDNSGNSDENYQSCRTLSLVPKYPQEDQYIVKNTTKRSYLDVFPSLSSPEEEGFSGFLSGTDPRKAIKRGSLYYGNSQRGKGENQSALLRESVQESSGINPSSEYDIFDSLMGARSN